MSNKKVAIVTWARGVNYGTILQAFSLTDTLRKHGYDAVLLDDSILTGEFKAQASADKDVKTPPQSSQTKNGKLSYYLNKIKKAIYVFSSPKRYRNYKNERTFERVSSNKKRAFEEFKKAYLTMSEPFGVAEYDRVGNEYDAYVCGSDQIWTIKSKPEYHYYYLGFTDDSKKRIAYAPCIGEYKIPDFAKSDIKNLTERFDKIAMRDNHGSKLISETSAKSVSTVLDPVLLKTPTEWQETLSLQKTNEKYLLCYILGTHKWYNDYIKLLSESMGLKIKWIPVNPEQTDFLYGNTSPCGPKEFVELIYNAEYVCTDSYHGTLFSLLFNKQLTILERYTDSENSQNERFYSLFNQLGISKQIISEKTFEKSDTERLNYDIINRSLAKEREKSLQYLLSALD